VHIIGPRAADMIAECVLAVEFGASSEDIARTIHGHPTLAEALQLKRADNLFPYPEFEEKGSDPALCKYVKSLSFKFYDKDGIEFDVWDSDSDEFGYATPKAIAIKLELANKTASHTFETMVSLPVSREKTD